MAKLGDVEEWPTSRCGAQSARLASPTEHQPALGHVGTPDGVTASPNGTTAVGTTDVPVHSLVGGPSGPIVIKAWCEVCVVWVKSVVCDVMWYVVWCVCGVVSGVVSGVVCVGSRVWACRARCEVSGK